MPTQRSSLNRDYDLDDDRRRAPERRTTRRSEPDSPDREISLGAGTILGIFFALAITCGVFFGFGYQMGRKASQSAVTAPADPNATDATSSNSAQSASKPSANNPFQAAQALFKKDPTAKSEADESMSAAESGSPKTSQSSRSVLATPTPVEATSGRIKTGQNPASNGQPRATQPTLVRASTTAPAAASAVAQSVAMPQPAAATATGTFIVQVAAVSHQEDAELLDSALKQRGYAVFVRREPQDHLLHVQVGPFASRRDADVVRQHLLADGYNALLK